MVRNASPAVDFCIVGGGISGLYFAKRLREAAPGATYTLLEADPRRFGGRIQVARFHGVPVVEGAAVGRVEKDVRLLALCRELRVDHPRSPQRIGYSAGFGMTRQGEGAEFVMAALAELRARSRAQRRLRTQTFSAFARETLGGARYDLFRRLVGYTDYEHADMVDTLDDYGFDDTYTDGRAPRHSAAVDWTALIARLLASAREGGGTAGGASVKGGARVLSVRRPEPEETAPPPAPPPPAEVEYTWRGRTHRLRCRHVVLAVPIDAGFASLLPRGCGPAAMGRCGLLGRQVRTQPFLRVYARVDRRASRAFERAMAGGYTVVPNVLQKIIPIDPEAGVYMVAYCDNAAALELQGRIQAAAGEDRAGLLAFFERLVRRALALPEPGEGEGEGEGTRRNVLRNVLRILDIRPFFWTGGTHFFRPMRLLRRTEEGGRTFADRAAFLETAVRPLPWVTVLGEGVSRDQGWTEGALTRVDDAVALMFGEGGRASPQA